MLMETVGKDRALPANPAVRGQASTEARPDAFHTGPGWFEPWRTAYLTQSTEPLTVGGLPMIADTARLGPLHYERLRGQTNVHTALFDLPESQPVSPDLQARLIGDRDLVTIEYVSEDSRLLAAARAWPDQSRVSIKPHALSPLADCRQPYAEWLARRSKRSRQRWPSLERKLIGQMGLKFAIYDGQSCLSSLLDEMFAVEASGWKGQGGTAIRNNRQDELFYTGLAHRAAAVGALRVATLSLDDRIVAFEYGVVGADRLFLLKVGYDEAFEQHSIGHLLAVMHIRECCADPRIAWYDKMGNGMTPAAYKLRFNDTIDTLYRITIYGSNWRGSALRFHDYARGEAKKLRDRWRAHMGKPAA